MTIDIDQQYAFNGQKLIEYSHLKFFKDKITSQGFTVQGTSVKSIYEEVISQQPQNKKEIDKIYFENIFYGQLKNVYFQKIINERPEKTSFIEKVKAIITDINRNEHIPFQHHTYFNENGFYALDYLDVNKEGKVFIIGYDFEAAEDNKINVARFLIAQVVLRDQQPVYYLAALEVNYVEKFYLLMFRNMQGIDAIPNDSGLLDDEKWNRSMTSYIKRINNTFLNPLQIRSEFKCSEDRAGMYNMCKQLDDELLQEYRDKISHQIGNLVETSINGWFNSLDNGDVQPSNEQKANLKAKVSSQVLSLYLKNNPDIDLVKKARDIGQVGYTTKIEFKANKAGRGATKSRTGSDPIVTEDMFHSLYIDFKDALELPKWSMAWFTEKEDDYLQTTIHITSQHFRIVFLPDRHLDKESIYHVVGYISGFRNY